MGIFSSAWEAVVPEVFVLDHQCYKFWKQTYSHSGTVKAELHLVWLHLDNSNLDKKLYYQLVRWECSSEDCSLVIWRKPMTVLFSKRLCFFLICLTGLWRKMTSSGPNRNHRWSDLPKATKKKKKPWIWDPDHRSCSAQTRYQSLGIMKSSL